MKLSLMIHTASPDWFLRTAGIDGYFDALTHSLQRQTFQDFEFIYIDANYEETRERFAAIASQRSFPIKHVPVHPGHRYWYDKGYVFIAAAKNTGLLYADGEIVVSCDDGEFFPDNFLERYWHHYSTSGRFMHALHKRLRTIANDNGRPTYPINGDWYVNDKRWENVPAGHPYQHRYGGLLFAGTSYSLHDAVNLNGYNERLDGCKSLDDCDFGNRLKILGRSFVMDPQGWLAIVDHPSYTDDNRGAWPDDEGLDRQQQDTVMPVARRKSIENLIAVENFGMVRCAVELMDPVANKNPLTPQHWEIIRRETIKYRKFDPLAPEHAETLAIWKGTPTFDLRQEREELRRSPDWRW